MTSMCTPDSAASAGALVRWPQAVEVMVHRIADSCHLEVQAADPEALSGEIARLADAFDRIRVTR